MGKAFDGGGGGGVTNGSESKEPEGGGKWAGGSEVLRWSAATGMSQAEYYGVSGGIEIAVVDPELPEGRVVVDTLHPREFLSDQYTDLSEYLAGSENLRLEMTWLGEHRLDKMALSLPVEPPALDTLRLVGASHNVLGDVRAGLRGADSNYVTLDVGEDVDLVFETPTRVAQGRLQYIFLAKGYYLLNAGKAVPPGSPPRAAAPIALRLSPASPNPGAGSTRFRMELPSSMRVRLRIYDVLGRAVATLLDGQLPPGYHGSVWDGMTQGRRASAGVYFARMEAGGETQTRKFVLLK
jgi:hypothetical protein